MAGYENDLVHVATRAIIIAAGPVGIGASVVWGALANNGPRRIIGIILVLLTNIFVITILDKVFAFNLFGPVFGNDIDYVILTLPPIIATAWIFLIINYPLQNRSIDRLGLYGLALSLLAILFYLVALD